jgi:hypothetical protein
VKKKSYTHHSKTVPRKSDESRREYPNLWSTYIQSPNSHHNWGTRVPFENRSKKFPEALYPKGPITDKGKTPKVKEELLELP